MLNNIWGFSEFFLRNPILILALIAHVLADFQLQSQRMADLKNQRFPYLILHLSIVLLPLLLLTFILPSNSLYFLLIWVSHILIDVFKYKTYSFVKEKHLEKHAFLIDQLLHLISIILLYFYLADTSSPSWLVENVSVLQMLLFLAVIGKPVNICFKLFFSKYQSGEREQETIAGAGAMIGILERLIMGLSILFGQFTSIGLVFTAKSIARYNKISQSQAFAEYYLIGSLFSMISVLLVYGIFYL